MRKVGLVAVCVVALALLVVVPVVMAEYDVTTYTNVIDNVVSAIEGAVPTMVTAIVGVFAGLFILQIGVRLVRRFVR